MESKLHQRTNTVGSLGGRNKTIQSDNLFSRSHMLFAGPQCIGFADTLSSSTLRHTSPLYSFPKDNRFQLKEKLNSELEISLPTTLANKSVTFGYGNKQIFTPSMIINAKQNPSPDRYTVIKDVKNLERGKTFGLSHSAFRKVYIPTTLQNEELAKEIPPVGNYEVSQDPGVDKVKYTLKAKGRNLIQMNLDCPHSCTYSPKTMLQQITRFSDTGLGKGRKYDFTRCANRYPGPGTYALPSKFDKFDTKKQRVWKQQLDRRIQQRQNKQNFI